MESSNKLDASDTPRRRPRGLVQEIVTSFTNSIRDDVIKPGEKLPSESEIVEKFDVSRTVVREALSKLQASGLVETRHGIGTFALTSPELTSFKISNTDFTTIADVIAVLELRISLETEAAALAARRRTDADLGVMEEALKTFSDAINENSHAVPSDFAFHKAIARATGNRHFVDLMTYLGTMIIPRARFSTPGVEPESNLGFLRRVHGDHERILNAIRNHDSEEARASMRTHLSSSRERLRRAQLNKLNIL